MIVAEQYHPFPSELYGHGLHAVRYALAFDSESPLLGARTLGQPHLPHARRQALASGCLEAVLVSPTHQVVGTTEGVVASVKRGAVVIGTGQQPETMGTCLAELAREAGLAVEEAPLKSEELTEADEVLLAGTAAGVIGIVRLDGGDVAGGAEGPVTRTLRSAFERLAHGGAAPADDLTAPSRE
jgi:branched-chain amino acid aminotransferase